MDFELKFWLNIVLIFLQRKLAAEAKLYGFLIDDAQIFQDCQNEPDYLGIADMLDLSNLKTEFLDDVVHMEGSFSVVWAAKPSDRVELRCDVFKYERGSWQPTVFTLIEKDFCTTLFNSNNIWYQSWGKFIDADDAKCITNKGHTYHHQPFDLESVVDVQGEDISGLHKVVMKFDAFDQYAQKQPYSVCAQIVGDIVKK